VAEAARKEADPELISPQVRYQQICESHRAIVDFRAKLLGLLPLGTGATVFVVFKDVYGTNKERLLAPLGIVGFVVMLGLLVYELRGIQDYGGRDKRSPSRSEYPSAASADQSAVAMAK
jgi:hypothetical protein